MDSSSGLRGVYVCMHVNVCLWLCMLESTFVFLCARPRLHHFRVSSLQMNNTTGRQIHRKLFVSVACCWQNRGLICAHSPAFAVHLTSVTFGCSTKDSGVILGMSIWIWQQHGRKGVRHTHVHVHTITFNSLNRQYPRFSWVLWLLWLKQIPIPIDSYRYHSS